MEGDEKNCEIQERESSVYKAEAEAMAEVVGVHLCICGPHS